jgi:hypothetical protein
VRLEGLGKLKIFIDLMGIQTRDLPTCSIVPQPAAIPLNNDLKKDQNEPKKMGFRNVNWIHLAHNSVPRRTFANTLVNHLVPRKVQFV